MLTRKTKIFVFSHDGHKSEMTLEGVHRALVGGMKWEEVEMTTDPQEAGWLQRKWKAIQKVKEMMVEGDHDQAEQIAKIVDDAIAGDSLPA